MPGCGWSTGLDDEGGYQGMIRANLTDVPRYPLSIKADGRTFNFTKSYEELVEMGILVEKRQ